MANIVLGSKTVMTENNGSVSLDVTSINADNIINSNYNLIRRMYSWQHNTYFENMGNSLTLIVEKELGTAVQTNSHYTFSANIWTNNDSPTNSDSGDICIVAFLENADGSKKYRFGMYKNNSGINDYRIGGGSGNSSDATITSLSGGYFLMDSDGGHYHNSVWNGHYNVFVDIPGNQAVTGESGNTDVTPPASTFTAGEMLTCKVYMGSQNNINYNVANYNGTRSSRNWSFYNIKEYNSIG